MRTTFSPEEVFLLLADTAEKNLAVYRFAGLRTDAADARMDAIRYRRQAASAAKEARRPINGRRRHTPKIDLLCYLTPKSAAPLPTPRHKKSRRARSRRESELALDTVDAE